jgi:cobalt-zinc-cadmium efflux system outer membrane protein
MRVPLVSVLVLGFGCAAEGSRERDAMIEALSKSGSQSRLSVDQDVAFAGVTLDRAALVTAVLARNPDLDVARETWRATIAAYPTVSALSDPMVTYEVAPLSIGSSVPFGQRIAIRQKLPYPGKRQLAAEAVLADGEAARADYETLRLELAEATVVAFDNYYVAVRALDVNAHHHQLIERVQKSATAQYTVGKASQQDPLEAEGELIALDREHLMLATQELEATARINRLLRRSPNATLPPPPDKLEPAVESAGPTPQHPKQLAATARMRSRASEIAGAERAFYPDLEVMASYDSMWSDWQHQLMIGVGIEIPLQRDGRRGVVERARAEQAKAAAELVSTTDTLAEDRERGRGEIDEATATIALYETRAIPNARTRVDAALAGFTSGQNSFSSVVMAEHALRDAELDVERARADLDRKRAAYARASGRIAGGGQ